MGLPNVFTLQGGYQCYRARVCNDLLDHWNFKQLRFSVVAGPTGVGKTRLLHALEREGAQILDLERLARHRGSVFGAQVEPQPNQVMFENAIWETLRRFDPAQPVWVESESQSIGKVRLPNALVQEMRESRMIWEVHLAMPHRVALIVKEYERLCDATRLKTDFFPVFPKRRVSVDTFARWKMLAEAQRWEALVFDFIAAHYDPVYTRSLSKNFVHLATAEKVDLEDGSAESLTETARRMMRKIT